MPPRVPAPSGWLSETVLKANDDPQACFLSLLRSAAPLRRVGSHQWTVVAARGRERSTINPPHVSNALVETAGIELFAFGPKRLRPLLFCAKRTLPNLRSSGTRGSINGTKVPRKGGVRVAEEPLGQPSPS